LKNYPKKNKNSSNILDFAEIEKNITLGLVVEFASGSYIFGRVVVKIL
jgi:hypothetical protein